MGGGSDKRQARSNVQCHCSGKLVGGSGDRKNYTPPFSYLHVAHRRVRVRGPTWPPLGEPTDPEGPLTAAEVTLVELAGSCVGASLGGRAG